MKTLRQRNSFIDSAPNGAMDLAPCGRASSAVVKRLAVLVVITTASILGVARGSSQSATQSSDRSEASRGSAENGKQLYMKYGCYECHSLQGQGSMASGPRIGPDPIPFSALVSYVRHPAGEMAPYSDKVVTDQELAEIYAFLESLPHPPDVKTIPLLH
jgi:mono/diheme cytochrome c family protein